MYRAWSMVFTFIACMCSSILGYSGLVFAQAAPIEVTDDQFIQLLVASLGGMKGATTLIIVGIVVKIVLAFMQTKMFGRIFTRMTGAAKLLVVSGLTIVSTILAQMQMGVSFVAALLQGGTLTAILVFGNQIYQHFWGDKKETPAVAVH